MKLEPVGNFAFMYEINNGLYFKLNSAEKSSRVNLKKSGQDARTALESLLDTIIKKNGLKKELGFAQLVDKIKKLRDTKYLKGKNVDINKVLLPDLGTVSYECQDGEVVNGDYWKFIRLFGNACSHGGYTSHWPVVNYENTVNCLAGLFEFFKKFYSNKLKDEVGDFDENIMPIGEYCVYEAVIPADIERSGCIREFKSYVVDKYGDKKTYAVLRLYRKTDKKSDANDVFMLRNQKCFTEASKMSYTTIPEGMAIVRELIPLNSKESPFYIICYEFSSEPYKVSDKFLANLSVKEKINLCRGVAECLYNLHTSPVPIYHRMLNYDCVYACKKRDRWIPYIIKFDYAKIAQNVATIQINASKAKEQLKREQKLMKYVAPEWDSILKTNDFKKWEKADVYSLGILCSDILYGEIGVTPPSIDELEELDLSDEILDLLDIMRSDDPNERWGIEEVRDAFDAEARRQNRK